MCHSVLPALPAAQCLRGNLYFWKTKMVDETAALWHSSSSQSGIQSLRRLCWDCWVNRSNMKTSGPYAHTQSWPERATLLIYSRNSVNVRSACSDLCSRWWYTMADMAVIRLSSCLPVIPFGRVYMVQLVFIRSSTLSVSVCLLLLWLWWTSKWFSHGVSLRVRAAECSLTI